jgi:hypothetical protein
MLGAKVRSVVIEGSKTAMLCYFGVAVLDPELYPVRIVIRTQNLNVD